MTTLRCPRCETKLRESCETNALSRVDNKTYICSDCGTREALFNFANPGRALPELDEPIVVVVR